jgi:cholesterol transport system auxiliary component
MKPWPFSLSPSGRPGARARAAIATLCAAALLVACSLSRPPLVKHMFLLEPAAPPAVTASRGGTVRIGAIVVAAPYRGRTLVYRLDESKYETDFYSEFFVAPAAMLAEATAKALAGAHVFQRVLPPGASPDDGDYVLDGFATELYGDMRESGKPAAALAVTFYLSTASALGNSVVWSKEYRQRVPAADASPEALVRAWNTALTTILAELSRDLASAQLAKPASPRAGPPAQ